MIHGGDIYRNEVRMDFSVNGNPIGMPVRVERALKKAVGNCGTYPDLRSEKLKEKLEKLTGVCREQILCGNGASELLLAALHGIKPKKTAILVPSFYGYEYAAAASGSPVLPVLLQAEDGFCLPDDIPQRLDDDVDLLLLANPNNPTGAMIKADLLEKLLGECLQRNITVVLDECFLEFTGKEETHSMKKKLSAYPNLIILRAFTKIFAIPGVRLGYLLCKNEELLQKMEVQLPEWNLSVFAQAAGAAACRETAYIERTVRLIKKERAYLEEQLKRLGITVFLSETNFLLLHTKLPLYEELLKKKILIRDCGNFRGLTNGYYRIAVKSRGENARLIRAIREIARRFV